MKLADDLSFPVDVATQTTLIVGKRGSGKSNTAVVLAEGLHAASVPFVVIDPVDNWWGLKATRNGRDPGLQVHVFGGSHADMPIEPRAGALLADVVVDHRISAVFAVRDFSGADRNRFVTDFARRLLARNREPLHVFLEEAHESAPQTIGESEVKAECVGAVTRLSKLGRSSGIGVSAITQRPASLSKNITTQAEILIVHRMMGPQDIKAEGIARQVAERPAEIVINRRIARALQVARAPALVPRPAAGLPAEGLTGPEQRVLDALAWWASIGVDEPTKIQLGFVAGYRVGKSAGGTFGNILGALRSRDLVGGELAQNATCSITFGPAGFTYAGRDWQHTFGMRAVPEPQTVVFVTLSAAAIALGGACSGQYHFRGRSVRSSPGKRSGARSASSE